MTAFEHRGIVEGYYGAAYGAAQRREWVREIGRWGMNRYLYAPKNDPLHRENWRAAYARESLDEFAELVRCGDESGVLVGFAMSPGLSIHYSSANDQAALVAKFRKFSELGSRFFSLALDDVPTTLQHDDDRAAFASLALAHVALAHALKASLPSDSILWLVPTDYVGIDPSDYLDALALELDASIEVAWTGRTVVSPEIKSFEAERRAATLGRKLLIWDNVPVNDGPMRPMLHLGPYVGRDATLTEHVSGILLNPMELPRASRLSLRTAADFLNDPEGYDAEVSWTKAARALGTGAPDAFERFAAAHRFSVLLPNDRDLELEVTFDRVRERHASSENATLDLRELDVMLEARSRAATEIRASLDDRALANELEPWLESYEVECLRMRIALDLLLVLEPPTQGERTATAMDEFFAYSRFEGRLTHLAGPIKASFGPRRVLYSQLRSLDDASARFGPDPALFLDQCLADTFVHYAEERATARLGARVARRSQGA